MVSSLSECYNYFETNLNATVDGLSIAGEIIFEDYDKNYAYLRNIGVIATEMNSTRDIADQLKTEASCFEKL